MPLIDADKLLADIKTLPIMSNWWKSFLPQLVQAQPTVDAVEVVRCKGRKYGVPVENGVVACKRLKGVLGGVLGGNVCSVVVGYKGDDFCSYGERRDE